MLCQNSFVETFEMSPLNENYLILSVNNNCGNRSISPRTPSPRNELRGIRLFRVISKKLSRRSKDHSVSTDSESRSSSSDSCSSSHNSRANQSLMHSSRSISPNEISSSSSDSGSDTQSRSRHHHSTSAESLRKLFQNLSLYSRSQSCSNAKDVYTKRKSSKKSTPKSILRTPTSYTYVKGMSGLPTQRIPVHQIKNFNSCHCSAYR